MRPRIDTREHILNEAERQFADLGYHGVSLRMVMKDAHVQLAAVAYYFGVKENLFRAVIERRAHELNGLRLARMDAAAASAPDGVPTEQAIIEAFIGPLLDRCATGGPGWQSYARLIAQTTTAQWSELLSEFFDVVAARVINLLGKRFPGSPPQALYSCYNFILGSTMFVFSQSERLEILSKQTYRTSDLQSHYRYLVPFLASGVRGLLGNPEVARQSQPRGRAVARRRTRAAS